MSIWMFWKLFGDACLYFSVLGAFPTLFAHDFSFLVPAFLCGIGGMAASFLADRGLDHLAKVCILIPGAALLLPGSTIEYVMLVPILFYAAFVILRGEYYLDYPAYRDFFRKSILIWGIGFALLCIASAVDTISRPLRPSIAYDETLWMGMLYMVSGIVLQRQLRLGADAATSDKRMNGIQSAVVLGSTGAVLLGVWALERNFADKAQELMNFLGELLLYLFSLPLALIVWLLGPLFQDIQESIQETHGTETTESTVQHTATFASGEPTAPQPLINEPAGFPWWFVVLLLSVLLILLLTILKLYSAKREAVRSSTQFGSVQSPEEKQKSPRSGNRARVRKYYREYLKLEKRRGTKLKTNQTSADILEKSSAATNKKAAAALRRIYLKARYNEAGTVTNEDVQRAKDAVKQLRG